MSDEEKDELRSQLKQIAETVSKLQEDVRFLKEAIKLTRASPSAPFQSIGQPPALAPSKISFKPQTPKTMPGLASPSIPKATVHSVKRTAAEIKVEEWLGELRTLFSVKATEEIIGQKLFNFSQHQVGC